MIDESEAELQVWLETATKPGSAGFDDWGADQAEPLATAGTWTVFHPLAVSRRPAASQSVSH